MPDRPSGSILEKKTYTQPKDIKMETTPGEVVLTRRWTFKPDDIFIGGIGLLLLIFELGNLLFGSSSGFSVLELIFIIFGPIMVYFSLAHRFNSTRFSVGPGKITVRKGPLPWFGSRTLSSAEVVKLSFRGEEHRSMRSKWYTYPVFVSLRNGKETVLETCEQVEHAGFLSQELERCLGISR